MNEEIPQEIRHLGISADNNLLSEIIRYVPGKPKGGRAIDERTGTIFHDSQAQSFRDMKFVGEQLRVIIIMKGGFIISEGRYLE